MWQYNYTDELYHHGVLGMKWGRRKERYSDGSLTRHGAKKLARYLNKNSNSKNYVAIRYKDKQRKKNNMVYELNSEDKTYLKGKARVNTILAGPIGGALITSHQFNKQKYKQFSNPNRIGPKYDTITTIVGDENSLSKHLKK